jgi:uncharacterized protein (TIGR03435 family)
MTLIKKILAITSTVGLAAGLTLAQTTPAKKSFEVASVKPSTAGNNFVGIGRQPGGRFTANNVPLRLLIQNAFRVRDFQIMGGPDWMATERWNIDAKAEEGSIPTPTGPSDPNVPDSVSLMLQSLLEDRFQMKFHRETRELPVYNLLVSKDGAKMKSVDPPPRTPPGQGPPPPPPPVPFGPGGGMPANFTPPPGSIMMMPGGISGGAMSMGQIVNVLSSQVCRSVIDKTDLKGFYDVRLQFAPDSSLCAGLGPLGIPGGPGTPGLVGGPGPGPGFAPPPSDPQGPTIFTAVQEQLGLRLESTKGPVEVIVIDNVQKPAEN